MVCVLLSFLLVMMFFSIVTDACVSGVGGVLQVKRKDVWLPAAFFSRQTKGAEKCYSATELEALELVESVQHFATHLYGNEFVAWMDHRALVSLMTSPRLNPRLKRFVFKLQRMANQDLLSTGRTEHSCGCSQSTVRH